MTAPQPAAPRPSPGPLISVRRLAVEYRLGASRKIVRALNDVSLDVSQGEIIGIVGESGSGKSTLGRAILGLAPISRGGILIDGQALSASRRADRRRSGRFIQCVFQDPYSSLNPYFTVEKILLEPLIVHREVTGDGSAQVAAAMTAVGLAPDLRTRRPRQLSGGQCQRVAIARALMLNPKVIICDEPTSSLDVSVQAQILDLLLRLRSGRSVSLVFISHDLAVVSRISDRVVVMSRGNIVEQGRPCEIYGAPLHPYTAALLSAVPIPDPVRERTRRRLKVPEPGDAASVTGCPYRDQCWMWRDLGKPDVCATTFPELVTQGDGGRMAACHFAGHMRAWAG
ncbi:MAG: oligopeptide/dipeptide ABC transporter ATP-binding protein [Parvibaculaceae bacterium]